MKKYILLLLLATFGMQAQTLQNPTYGNVKLKNNQTSTTATKVNVQENDGTINTKPLSELANYVEFASAVNLPVTGEQGKLYLTKDNNKIYRWNGTFYQELASSDPTYQSVIDALTFTPENVANKSSTLTASSTLYPNNDAVIAGLALKEDKVNKVTSISLSANDTNYPSELAVKTYADNLVVGMLNDRGIWDASGNVFPTTGGSGVGGAIRKGDMWYVSVAGTLGAKSVNVGDSFRALVNAPSQVAANWSILEANIGYVPANDSNVVHLAGAETITGQKTFSPTISASGAIARGTYLTPSLTATANNDVLVGLDIAPTFNNGAFTGVKNISARFNGLADVRASGVGSKFSFGDGSLYFGWNNGNYLDIISAGGLRVGNQGFIKLQLFSTTGSLILQNGGTFTDDGVNRLQVAGTISSGTTALGNTPPTANNQLTRKDYVDSGLNSKEPSFTKNTAFNKNFGTTAGTVVEGNYPPAKDGTGATGTWGINISGLAANSTKWNGLNYGSSAIATPAFVLGTVNGVDYGFTSTAQLKTALNISDGSTLNNNITGNAANSTLWNGYDMSVAPTDVAPSGILSYYNSGVTFQRSSATALSSFLGLGSNAYSSTAFLPLSGGNVSGSVGIGTTTPNKKLEVADIDSQFSLKGTITGAPVYQTWYNSSNVRRGYFGFASDSNSDIRLVNEEVGNIYITPNNGSTIISSTVTAAPATAYNHLVTKAQLDAVANIAGTSGDFLTTVTNAVNVSGFFVDSATYTRIGNIVNANISMSLSSSTAGLSTFNLTLPFAKGNNSGAAVGSGSALTSITVFPVSVRSLNSTTAFVSVNTPSASNMLVSVNFQYDVTK